MYWNFVAIDGVIKNQLGNYVSCCCVLNAMPWSVTKAVRPWLDFCSDDATYHFLPRHLHFVSEIWTIGAKRSVNIGRECMCWEQTIEPELQRLFFSLLPDCVKWSAGGFCSSHTSTSVPIPSIANDMIRAGSNPLHSNTKLFVLRPSK
jgi:hypothetical protein